MSRRRPPPPASLQVLHGVVAALGCLMLGLVLRVMSAEGLPADPWLALPAGFLVVAAGTVLLIR